MRADDLRLEDSQLAARIRNSRESMKPLYFEIPDNSGVGDRVCFIEPTLPLFQTEGEVVAVTAFCLTVTFDDGHTSTWRRAYFAKFVVSPEYQARVKSVADSATKHLLACKEDEAHAKGWHEGVGDALRCLKEPGIVDKGDCIGRLERLRAPPGEPPKEETSATYERVKRAAASVLATFEKGKTYRVRFTWDSDIIQELEDALTEDEHAAGCQWLAGSWCTCGKRAREMKVALSKEAPQDCKCPNVDRCIRDGCANCCYCDRALMAGGKPAQHASESPKCGAV